MVDQLTARRCDANYHAIEFAGEHRDFIIARKVEPKYRERVDFVHVEIYKDPGKRIPAGMQPSEFNGPRSGVPREGRLAAVPNRGG